MPNLMSGIHLALQSLLANTQAIEITEHNVSNASTPGYRRQAPGLVAAPPVAVYGTDHGMLAGLRGSGVTIERIQRFSLAFFDGRYRSSAGSYQAAAAHSEVLSQMETLLNETAETGSSLPAHLDTFWQNWQQLSGDSTNTTLRSQLLHGSQRLTEAFQERVTQLNALRVDLDQRVAGQVQEINEAARQVAWLNGVVARYQNMNIQPNDFLDARDRQLDRLAEIAGAVSHLQPDGQVLVSISGHALVSGSQPINLQAGSDPITWENGVPFTPAMGSLSGLLNARDKAIPEQLAGLNSLASGLMNGVNALHRSGFGLNGATGLDFFSGTSANTIVVNAAIDISSVAAAGGANQPGDGIVAGQIAALNEVKTFAGGLETYSEFIAAHVARLGQQVRSAREETGFQKVIAEALDQQRESLGGVSLDEEAANLVRYQKAYQAAARLMTTYDEMLDRIINQMGLVGR